MSDSARDRAAADDLAAQRNEQVAQGHEWAAQADHSGSSDQHRDAATERRRTAGKIAPMLKPPEMKTTNELTRWCPNAAASLV